MKLLLDQNLSRNLIGRFRDNYPDSVHVTVLNLDTATDRGCGTMPARTVHDRLEGLGVPAVGVPVRSAAPKVIWLRVGNVNSAAVFKVLNDHHEAIEAFEDATDEALLLLPGLPLGQVPR